MEKIHLVFGSITSGLLIILKISPFSYIENGKGIRIQHVGNIQIFTEGNNINEYIQK